MELLRVKQVAEIMNVTVGAVYALVNAKAIPHTRVGLSQKVRPMLRYARGLQSRLNGFEPDDQLRLATVAAGDALQDLLGGLHLLSLPAGSAGKAHED